MATVRGMDPTTVAPPAPAHIVVRGSGRARAMPDRAVLHVVVEGEGPTRADAYDLAARRAAAVDDAVTAFADDLDRTITAALVVHPKTRWHEGESRRTGWAASRTSSIEVVVFDRLGDLIAALAEEGTSLSGPDWQLDPTNAAYADARRLAAEDARRRADVYAAALGLRVTAVARVAEPDLRGPSHQPMHLGATAMVARAGGPADEVIEVAPAEVLVEAEVDVGFAFASATD